MVQRVCPKDQITKYKNKLENTWKKLLKEDSANNKRKERK